MKRVERDGLSLFAFPSLEELGVSCYISTRPLNVREYDDRQRFLAAAGVDPARTMTTRQVHKSDIVRVDGPFPGEPPEADGIVTDVAGLPLLMRAADCSLIVVADPDHRALGVAHAGWRGSARGVIVNLVRALHDHYGSKPSRLRAGIGPTIGFANFAVGPEVPAAFLRSREWVKDYITAKEGKWYFDLRGVNVRFLVECGLSRDAIEAADECTFSSEELHSFRRDGVEAGHHGMLAVFGA